MIKVAISIGELVDKASILSIKAKKVKNKEKLINILQEYELLKSSMAAIGIDVASDVYTALEEVNLRLWDIEDRIRIKEANREFDDEFIQLARSIYFTNDRRADIKKEINIKYGSDLVEEKEYVDYQR